MKNTFVKVLSMMMALMMVVGMFSVITVSAADHEHTKGEYIDGKDPTCQKPGFSRWICGICEEEWITDIIQPSDEYHDIEEVPAISASCLTAGYSAGRRCLVPGCTEIAEGCDLVAPAKAHTFVGKEVAPTCFDKGWVVYTCTSCGKTAEWLNDNNKFLVATQTYATWAKVETGKAQLVHKYDWTIVTAPVSANGACTNGLAKGVCANCGDVKTAEIPVTHSYTVNLNPNNVTCGEYKSGFACSVCGDLKDAVKNDADKVGVHTVGYTVPSGTTFDVNNLPAKNAAGTVKFTIAELKGLGFTEGQVISKDATCTAAGTLLVICSCGEVSFKPVAVKAHSYGEWGAIDWPELCTEAAVRVRTCSCGAKDTKVIVEAAYASHAEKNVVTPSTCTGIGFTETTCTNKFVVNGVEKTCEHYSKHTYKDADGHDWSAPIWVSGNCGSADYTRKCNTCNVDYEVTTGETVAEPDANKTHKYGTEVTVPATCKDPSYKSKVCQICNFEVRTAIQGAQTNPAAHIYPTGAALLTEGANVEFVINKAPTCTKDGEAIVWCTNCTGDARTASMKTVNTGMKAHTYTTTTENCYKVTTQSGFELKFADLAAKCNAYGYTANGTYCSVCGFEAKPATRIEKNPNVHGGTTVEPVGDPVSATCQDGAYQMYNTSCCGLVKTYTNGGVKAAHKYENAEHPEKVTKYYTAPTCTTAGNHQYTVCEWCGNKKPLSTVATNCTFGCSDDAHALLTVSDDHVIPALGHNYKPVELDKATDCEDTGFNAYEDCDRCTYVKYNGTEYNTSVKKQNDEFIALATIPAHYNAHKEYKAPLAATCWRDGVKEGVYCTVCEDGDWVISKDTVAHIMVPFTVNLKDNGVTPIDCTKATCTVNKCSVCGFSTADYQPAINNNGHDFPNAWTKIDLNPAAGEYSCNTNTMEKRVCADCGKEEIRVKTYATGCYTTKGVENGEKFFISYDCDKIAEFIGWSCDVCHDVVDVTDLKHNVGDPEIKNPTCTADGYEIQYCKGCGLTERKDSIAFYEPIYRVLTPVDGNYDHDETNGIVLEDNAEYKKYICADCKETVTRYYPVATPSDDIAVVLGKYNTLEIAGDKYTNASQVAITVALKTEQAINVNMINLQVQYSNNLKYDGFAFADGIEFTSFQDAADNNDDSFDKDDKFVEGEADFISITAATEFDKGQAPVDAVIDGELQLVTLYFTIVNAKGSEANASVAVTVAEFYNTKSDNKLDVVLGSSATCAIKVEKFMDVNGNGYFNAKDLAIAAELFADDAYNVAADVDKDGEITYTDLIAIQDYINGVRTYDEIAALGSEA